MMKKSVLMMTAAVCVLAGTAAAGEIPGSGPGLEEERPATFLETAVHGAGMGAFTGLAAGWVRYADEYEMQNVWESVGYGAAAGLGVGAGAALLGPEGAGDRVLDTVEAGAGLGGGVGFVWGVVSALFTGDSSRVGSGLAWGHLAGITAGIGYAGYRVASGAYAEPAGDEEPEESGAFVCAPGVVVDVSGTACPALTVTRRF